MEMDALIHVAVSCYLVSVPHFLSIATSLQRDESFGYVLCNQKLVNYLNVVDLYDCIVSWQMVSRSQLLNLSLLLKLYSLFLLKSKIFQFGFTLSTIICCLRYVTIVNILVFDVSFIVHFLMYHSVALSFHLKFYTMYAFYGIGVCLYDL